MCNLKVRKKTKKITALCVLKILAHELITLFNYFENFDFVIFFMIH